MSNEDMSPTGRFFFCLENRDYLKKEWEKHKVLTDVFEVEGKSIRVDSRYTADYENFETFISVGSDMNNTISEIYPTEEAMVEGHSKWVERMKKDISLPPDVHWVDYYGSGE